MDLTENDSNYENFNNNLENDNNENKFTTYEDAKNIYEGKNKKKYDGIIFKQIEKDIDTTLLKMKKNGASFKNEDIIKQCLLDFYIESNNHTYEASITSGDINNKGMLIKCDFCGIDIMQVLQGGQLVKKFIKKNKNNEELADINDISVEELNVKDLKEKLLMNLDKYKKIFTKEGEKKIQNLLEIHGFNKIFLFLQGMFNHNNSLVTCKAYIKSIYDLSKHWDNRKSIILSNTSKITRNTHIKALKSFSKHTEENDPELKKNLKLSQVISKKTLNFNYHDVYVEVYALSRFCFETKNLKLIKKALIILLLFETAFRISDIVSLKFKNMSFNTDRYALNIYTNKTGVYLSLWITDLCAQMINFIKENNIKEKIFIFSNNDEVKTTRNIRKHIDQIVKKLPKEFQNLKKIKPHDYRRLLLSKLADLNDISYAKKISGHSNINTLFLYLRGYNEEKYDKMHKCLQDNKEYKKPIEPSRENIEKRIEKMRKNLKNNGFN